MISDLTLPQTAKRSLLSNSVITSHLTCSKCLSLDVIDYGDNLFCKTCKNLIKRKDFKSSWDPSKGLKEKVEIPVSSLEDPLVSSLLDLGYSKPSIYSMIKCGTMSGFSVVKSCDCGKEVIPLTYHCSLRTCSNCSKIRKRRISRKYLPFLQKVHQDRKNFLYFLTISPRNYENLEEGMDHIKKSFSKFIRHKYIQERIKGGLYVIEAKGKEGNWNVHIHAIIYGRFIDNKVRKEKDSKIVRFFNQSSDREVNIHITKQNSVRFTLNYMLKYISSNKNDFETVLDMAKYMVAIKGKRLIQTFGCFHKIKFEKQICICNKCHQRIEYIIDQEIISIIQKVQSESRSPPRYSPQLVLCSPLELTKRVKEKLVRTPSPKKFF